MFWLCDVDGHAAGRYPHAAAGASGSPVAANATTQVRSMPDHSEFSFRVSDVLQVPLRGYLLRLKVTDGTPRMKDLRRGRWLRMRSPEGEERTVRLMDFSTVGGRPTQERLDTARELDVVVPPDDVVVDGRRIDIGWTVVGVADERGDRDG
jgi:hypothetical protein